MSSFTSALSGLKANQSWIDVIGHNLANVNTPAFKASRVLFADLLSHTMKSGTAPDSSLGGTNPMQVGYGVQVSSIDEHLVQGALDLTNRTFDLALLGRGYFAVTDGIETYYTRVGSFGLDSAGDMVDQRTGYRVLNASGQTFSIDTSAVFPPSATTEVGFSGNLPAEISGPLAEVLSASTTFSEGTAAQTTGTASGPFTIPVGEVWTMELIVNGGAPETVSITGTGSMTATDIANEISAQSDHVTATVGAGQEIVLTSDKSGLGSTIAVNPGQPSFDLKGLLGLADFVQGTESVATATTDLNDLTSNLADYVAGETIQISGTDMDGSPVSGSFQYGVDGTTIGDLVTFIDGLYPQSTAAFDPTTGLIEVTSDTTGDADLSLAIVDGTGQTGSTDWAVHAFAVTTNGSGPDQVVTTVEVFDSTGTSRVLTNTYTRQANGSWNLDVTVDPSQGTVVSGTVTGITFNTDGSIQAPTSGAITIQFASLPNQTMTFDLGTAGQFDGLTQFGSPSSVVADFQDGYGAGELSSMSVDPEGTIDGFYTNGQTQVLGNFGVATFANPEGLEHNGDNYLQETPNSGTRILGAGKVGAAGEVIGGAIEASNVDTAAEFVHLIQAQRGFQANARVVTVQDELLSEVVNLI